MYLGDLQVTVRRSDDGVTYQVTLKMHGSSFDASYEFVSLVADDLVLNDSRGRPTTRLRLCRKPLADVVSLARGQAVSIQGWYREHLPENGSYVYSAGRFSRLPA